MKRRPTNAKLDKKIFSATAISKKKINLEPIAMRGGERL